MCSSGRIAVISGTMLGAFAVGFGVAVVAGAIANSTHHCSPDLSDDECGTFLVVMAAFIITLAVVPVIAMPVLACFARLGSTFIVGSTVAVGLIGIGTYGLFNGSFVVFYPLGLAVLVVTTLATNRTAVVVIGRSGCCGAFSDSAGAGGQRSSRRAAHGSRPSSRARCSPISRAPGPGA